MLFLSIMFAVLVPQEEQKGKQLDDSFKYNNAAVEAFQQMAGEWKFDKLIIGGEEHPPLEIVDTEDSLRLTKLRLEKLQLKKLQQENLRITVSDYVFTQTSGPFEEIWKCVAFDSKLNAFKFESTIHDHRGNGLVTVKEGKPIIVSGKAPLVFEPNKDNTYQVLKRK